MLYASMGKRLQPILDHTQHIVIVAVAWVGVLHIKCAQQPDIKLRMMPELSPFLHMHAAFKRI